MTLKVFDSVNKYLFLRLGTETEGKNNTDLYDLREIIYTNRINNYKGKKVVISFKKGTKKVLRVQRKER